MLMHLRAAHAFIKQETVTRHFRLGAFFRYTGSKQTL